MVQTRGMLYTSSAVYVYNIQPYTCTPMKKNSVGLFDQITNQPAYHDPPPSTHTISDTNLPTQFQAYLHGVNIKPNNIIKS